MSNNLLKILVLVTFSVVSVLQVSAQEAPEYGLYWFKSGTDFKRASSGVGNNYYNPNKKTLIFAHGQQNNAIEDDFYESFDYAKHDPDYGFPGDLVAIWKAKGWNVGAFYWREFADDGVLEAESKVWSPNGIHGMRMKIKNAFGTVDVIEHEDLPSYISSKSVSDLFYEAYVDAMSSHGHQEIRLAGHSLGNQLVIAAGKKISDAVYAGEISANLHPDRIALLDPFYSNNFKPFWFFATTGERAADAAETMRDRGVSFELYRTSLTAALGEIVGLFTFDENSLLRLRKLSAHQDMRPWYINPLDIGPKHVAAPYLYFQSMQYGAEEVTLGGWTGPWYFRYWDPFLRNPTGREALSAAAPTWRVQQMMTDHYYWDQVGGRQSPTTADDQFVRKTR